MYLKTGRPCLGILFFFVLIFETFLGGALRHNVYRGYIVFWGTIIYYCSLACSQNQLFSFGFNFKSRWLDLFTVIVTLRKLPVGASLLVFGSFMCILGCSALFLGVVAGVNKNEANKSLISFASQERSFGAQFVLCEC